MQPHRPPLGLLLSQTAKAVSRAFDDALARTGGSLPVWLILLALRRESRLTHGELADRVGITGPTLTHHLNALEGQAFVRRERLPENRRVQFASLTEAGVDLFHRLRRVAQSHDQQLRNGLAETDEAILRDLLSRLSANVAQAASRSEQHTAMEP